MVNAQRRMFQGISGCPKGHHLAENVVEWFSCRKVPSILPTARPAASNHAQSRSDLQEAYGGIWSAMPLGCHTSFSDRNRFKTCYGGRAAPTISRPEPGATMGRSCLHCSTRCSPVDFISTIKAQ